MKSTVIDSGADLTIRELAEMIAEVLGYDGKLDFDATKPDGSMRKVMDVSKIRKLGWSPETSLKEGIALTYKKYIGT